MNAQLLHGDCLERLKELPDNSVDAIVTDPPYGISFMSKKWDYDVPSEDIWRECLRVLKPGGHLLAFAGTRTQHRMAVRIEDAGFEIRDLIAWVYGSGFPKSLDVSKAIDKAAGVKFGSKPASGVGFMGEDGPGGYNPTKNQLYRVGESTEAARKWEGWGTALKPALEPVTVARKPFKGTVAENVLEWGTGAINVDGCRVGTDDDCSRKPALVCETAAGFGRGLAMGGRGHDAGRWPANLIHDGSHEVVELFPDGHARGNKAPTVAGGGMYGHAKFLEKNPSAGDSGSAARFFYCAKASKRDRDEGCEGFEAKRGTVGNKWTDQDYRRGDDEPSVDRRNHHPTVKPTALMRYLCRLVTPPGGTVLDPFMGSGSTGKAAMLEGFQFIGIEREAEYLEIAKARIEHAAKSADPQLDMPGMV